MAGRVARDQTAEGLGHYLLPLGALVGLLIVALGLVVLVDRSGATNLPVALAGLHPRGHGLHLRQPVSG